VEIASGGTHDNDFFYHLISPLRDERHREIRWSTFIRHRGDTLCNRLEPALLNHGQAGSLWALLIFPRIGAVSSF
jgi:hypothetical protein